MHANGSSKHAPIKPFDQLFALHAIGKVDLTQSWTNQIAESQLQRAYKDHVV